MKDNKHHILSWQHLQDTLQQRQEDTSAASDEAVLLLGGQEGEYSSEWIPVDGSPARPGAIMVGHGAGHCTIQLSADVIVLSGGYNTESYVTEYQLSDGLATPLSPMHQMREGHACGVYQDAGGHQVRKLSGCRRTEMNQYIRLLQVYSKRKCSHNNG